MQATRILGGAVLVAGVILLAFAYHASNAPLDKLSETFTGRYTDQTMWYLVLGAAGTVAGLLLVAFGGRR